MSKDIKAEFGRIMRLSRDAKGMSRATLAFRLGISPKTIQSWEMGRTFIERLDLIPQLEAELECPLSTLIAQATGGLVRNNGGRLREETGLLEHHMGVVSQQRLATRPGPLSPHFTIQTAPGVVAAEEAGGAVAGEADIEADWVSAPLVKSSAALHPVNDIQTKDVVRQVLVPREWVPRAGVIIAVRMGDSAMKPMIPLGATVVIDMRPVALEKSLGKIIALDFTGKGLRIRRVIRGESAKKRYFGAGILEHGRALIPIRPEKNDRILGAVIGVMAAV